MVVGWLGTDERDVARPPPPSPHCGLLPLSPPFLPYPSVCPELSSCHACHALCLGPGNVAVQRARNCRRKISLQHSLAAVAEREHKVAHTPVAPSGTQSSSTMSIFHGSEGGLLLRCRRGAMLGYTFGGYFVSILGSGRSRCVHYRRHDGRQGQKVAGEET